MKVNNGFQYHWYPCKNQIKENDGFESTEAGSREIIEDHLVRAGVLISHGGDPSWHGEDRWIQEAFARLNLHLSDIYKAPTLSTAISVLGTKDRKLPKALSLETDLRC